ncbi:MAG: hypothetical protein HC805_07800 [Alkalinema sp. RL_2_19]|nr:hypothetical protein [Alkalinema sp. RL_2_19]
MFAEEFVVCGDTTASTASQVLASQIQDTESLTQSLSENMALVGTIESALNQSLVYRRAVESLQQLTAEQGIDGQILLKAVSLEAIRLTLQAMEPNQSASTQHAVSTVEPMTPPTAITTTIQSNLDADELLDNDVFEAIETVVHTERQTANNPLTGLLNRYKAKRQSAVEASKS